MGANEKEEKTLSISQSMSIFDRMNFFEVDAKFCNDFIWLKTIVLLSDSLFLTQRLFSLEQVLKTKNLNV